MQTVLTDRQARSVTDALAAARHASDSRQRYIRQGIALSLLTEHGTSAAATLAARFPGFTKGDWASAKKYLMARAQIRAELDVPAKVSA